MSGFVYIWRDRKYNRFYIGCHWGSPDDGYVCSSPWMKRAYARRPQDFRRRILSVVTTSRDDLYLKEQAWLDKVKADEIGTRYYNLSAKCLRNHWHQDDTRRLTVAEKISRAKTGSKMSEEGKRSLREKRKPTFGIKHTEEAKQKIRLARAKQVITEEHKESLRQVAARGWEKRRLLYGENGRRT